MSRQTTNYGLTKPDYTDTADIEVVNANMDIIDGALKVIDTKSNNVMSKNSSAWSSTVAYAVGQYCIYNNSLWKCLVQHSGQTPQESTYWARVSLDTLGSEINELNSNLFPTTRTINARFFFYSIGNAAVSTSVYVPNGHEYNYNIDYISITSGNELNASNFSCDTNVGSAGNGEYISLITWNNYNLVANKLVNCKITATLKS